MNVVVMLMFILSDGCSTLSSVKRNKNILQFSVDNVNVLSFNNMNIKCVDIKYC